MFRGHPKGLVPLFITEAFERFCFYGVRAIVLLYMWTATANGGIGWSKAYAIDFFATYLLTAYIGTIIGGWIADRYWGQRRAIYVGGLLMAAGYFTLATGGVASLYTGLALVCLGNGFFKPCVTTIFGSLYKQGDPARDSGYSLFYMGINLGAMIGPVACGSFTGFFRFSLGFMVAGFAMLVALGIFFAGRKTLGEIGLKPKAKVAGESHEPLTSSDKRRLGVVLFLTVFIMFFFAAFEQGSALIPYYGQEFTRRMLGSFEFPVAWFQSLNPFFVITLGPVMAWVWSALKKRQIELSILHKFAIGFCAAALSFVVMYGATVELGSSGSSSILWIVLGTMVMTLGELCITPILWSAVSRITPKRFLSMMMAVTLMGIGFGYKIGGKLGALIEVYTPQQIFLGIGALSLLFMLVALIFNGTIERLTHGTSKKKRRLAAEL